MMAMMKPAFTEAAIAVAGRIEAGEFADAGAAMAAFNEAMKAAMAKAMGGGFGGGSQGGFGGGRP
jgi:outer membrane translocation and assembly module TamA